MTRRLPLKREGSGAERKGWKKGEGKGLRHGCWVEWMPLD